MSMSGSRDGRLEQHSRPAAASQPVMTLDHSIEVLVVTPRRRLREGLARMRHIHGVPSSKWIFVSDPIDGFDLMGARRFDVVLFDADETSAAEQRSLIERGTDGGLVVDADRGATVIGLFDAPSRSDLVALVRRGGEGVMRVRPLPSPSAFAMQLETAVRRHRRNQDQLAAGSRLADLFENATVGIYRSTPRGRILFVNPALVRMLGYDDEAELLASHVEADRFYADFGGRDAWRSLVERDGHVKGHETSWRRRDGSPVWVRESARVVRNPLGRIEYYEGVVEDITDYKAVEAELRERSEALEAFAYAVSHDLRTPIVTLDFLVTELAELRASTVADAGEEAELLERVRRSVDLMDRMTSGLLEFARLDQTPSDVRSVSLPRLVDEVVSRFVTEGQGPAPHLVIDVPDIKGLEGSSVLLGQALQNLMGNAFKHVPADGGVVRIAARVDEEGAPGVRCVVIEVADNGRGIAPALRETVFRLFERGPDAGNGGIPGTGMGLTMARRIVEHHGGRLWADEAPEGGALFVLRLPLVGEPVGPDDARAADGSRVVVKRDAPDRVTPRVSDGSPTAEA